MLHRKNTVESVVSDQQQHNFKIAYRLLNRVNEISWAATAFNAFTYVLNPLNASQFIMESADLGMARAIGGAAEKDRQGLHLEASKRREKIYYAHAAVASANLPITYFTWENSADLSPRSLGLSATVGFLSLVGLLIDNRKGSPDSIDEISTAPETAAEHSTNMHKQNNVAVKYINGSNFAEASLAIAGAGAYKYFENAPAVATLLTGFAVGALMIKGAVNERSFRGNNLKNRF